MVDQEDELVTAQRNAREALVGRIMELSGELEVATYSWALQRGQAPITGVPPEEILAAENVVVRAREKLRASVDAALRVLSGESSPADAG